MRHMLLYQKLCLVLAKEGISGVCRRARRKIAGPRLAAADSIDAELAAEHAEYVRLREGFAVRTRELGLAEEVAHYSWYHTIDLGDGLVTPGDYDYRASLAHYRLPANLAGRSVLDVGSATGFFAFEMEKRGGQVVSVELPSLAAWDMVRRERDRIVQGLIERCQATDADHAYHRLLDGPFQFCHRLLKSGVRRHYSSIYDLTPGALGTDGFDLIFLADVFSHLQAPLPALDVLANLCRDRLILACDLVGDPEDRPILQYVAAPDGTVANRSWWMANFTAVKQMLRTVGFRRVEIGGEFFSTSRALGRRIRRFVIHAKK
jgi:SAM-dependent methyltransferase